MGAWRPMGYVTVADDVCLADSTAGPMRVAAEQRNQALLLAAARQPAAAPPTERCGGTATHILLDCPLMLHPHSHPRARLHSPSVQLTRLVPSLRLSCCCTRWICRIPGPRPTCGPSRPLRPTGGQRRARTERSFRRPWRTAHSRSEMLQLAARDPSLPHRTRVSKPPIPLIPTPHALRRFPLAQLQQV